MSNNHAEKMVAGAIAELEYRRLQRLARLLAHNLWPDSDRDKAEMYDKIDVEEVDRHAQALLDAFDSWSLDHD